MSETEGPRRVRVNARATGTGYDGFSRRFPGDEFSIEINEGESHSWFEILKPPVPKKEAKTKRKAKSKPAGAESPDADGD